MLKNQEKIITGVTMYICVCCVRKYRVSSMCQMRLYPPATKCKNLPFIQFFFYLEFKLKSSNSICPLLEEKGHLNAFRQQQKYFFNLCIFYCCSGTVSPFSHLPPHPSPLRTLETTPLSLCACVLYTCSLMTLPSLPLSPIIPHYIFPPSPLATVSLFFISVSLVIFCFLV